MHNKQTTEYKSVDKLSFNLSSVVRLLYVSPWSRRLGVVGLESDVVVGPICVARENRGEHEPDRKREAEQNTSKPYLNRSRQPDVVPAVAGAEPVLVCVRDVAVQDDQREDRESGG